MKKITVIIELIFTKKKCFYVVQGDARRALDICRRATEIAEVKKAERIDLTHVNKAYEEMFMSPKVSRAQKFAKKFDPVKVECQLKVSTVQSGHYSTVCQVGVHEEYIRSTFGVHLASYKNTYNKLEGPCNIVVIWWKLGLMSYDAESVKRLYPLVFESHYMIFLHFFYKVINLFLHQSYLKSPLPVKLTW